MIVTKSAPVLLSLILMNPGSYFSKPVVAYTAFQTHNELKAAVIQYCGNTFDPDGSHGYG